jgi:excisionase family DNA binding protein
MTCAAHPRVTIPEEAEYLTYAQAAALLQVCPTTVRALCKRGKLRRYGEGRICRVRRAELEAYLAGTAGETKPRVDVHARAAAILQAVRGG